MGEEGCTSTARTKKREQFLNEKKKDCRVVSKDKGALVGEGGEAVRSAAATFEGKKNE